MATNEIGEQYSRKVVVMKIDGAPGLTVYSNIKKFWDYLEKNFTHYERQDPRYQFEFFRELSSYSTFMKYFRIGNRMQMRVRDHRKDQFDFYESKNLHTWKKITVEQFDVK